MPDHFKALIKDNQFHASFYTYDHISYKVYKILKYVWLGIHFWDTKIANKFFPAFNLGYDTLEFDDGELVIAGTVKCGYLNYEWNWTWAEIRQGVSGHVGADTVYISNAIQMLVSLYSGGNWLNQYCLLQRGVMSFNTSLLPDNTNIISAQIRVDFAAPLDTHSSYANDNLVLVSHEKVTSYALEENDLVIADYPYDQFGSTAFSETTWDYYVNNPGYHIFELNPAGCGYIKKTSHTVFGLMLKFDMEDDEPYQSEVPDSISYNILISPDCTIDVIYSEIGPTAIVMIQ